MWVTSRVGSTCHPTALFDSYRAAHRCWVLDLTNRLLTCHFLKVLLVQMEGCVLDICSDTTLLSILARNISLVSKLIAIGALRLLLSELRWKSIRHSQLTARILNHLCFRRHMLHCWVSLIYWNFLAWLLGPHHELLSCATCLSTVWLAVMGWNYRLSALHPAWTSHTDINLWLLLICLWILTGIKLLLLHRVLG